MTSRPNRRYRTAAGTARRQPRVRRASGGLTPTRSAAILAMLIALGALFGLATTSAFGFRTLDVEGALLTPVEAVRSAAAIEPGTNLVGLATEPIAARIRELTPVRDVAVSVGLPDTLRIAVTERRPIVIWQTGGVRYAVDDSGLLFAVVGADPGGPTESIPVVIDERADAAGLGVRSTLDPVILDAATRIASLTPAQIGSHASALTVRITVKNGFTVSSGPDGWLAIFGFYGTSQRTPELIPGQVQSLTAVLAKGEDRMDEIVLADTSAGTYTLKPTPRPSAKASQSAAP
ncbi:MAG TPA: FtsQ-type POTRA domain-containing protein [Candidatus Limnocylindrales bacterium]|nr:FtsQ-type POTRA domain-containing protein [Candidatus Limnocylindrales bacterium]